MKEAEVESKLLALPKIDLHCHLEGAVRPQTVFDLSKEQGIALPAKTAEDVRSLVSAEGVCDNLVAYLQLFDPIMRCIQTAPALRRIARETVEDAAACGVVYLEVRFAPQQLLEGGLTLDEVIEAVLDGMAEGSRETGTLAKAIVICMRHHTPDCNEAVLESAMRFGDRGVCAIDLAGDEAGYPPMTQATLFERATRCGMPYTIHAGESAGAESIKEALLLGAKRIGHGVRVREDSDLMRYCARCGVGLELCLTSNIHTHAADGWENHPMRDYFDAGLKVTCNTDNPTISNTDMYREYVILHARFGFGIRELEQLALNAVDISFATAEEKRFLKEKIRKGCRES